MIAPMSYGALSKSTKIALAKASALSDICDNSGEGGLIPEVRDAAKRVVVQCLGGRLGWNVHAMRQADGVEIYISQGAKPGLGGQLMAKKVTEDIARLRGIPAGIDLRSPSRHPDVLGADDLVIKVEEFREATGWEKPVSVKLGAGRDSRRHQDRLQGRLRLRLPRRPAGLDGRRGQRGARVRRHPDALGDHGGARRARRDRGDGHADHAHGRRQGRDRHRQGDRARRARRRDGYVARSSRAAASRACSAHVGQCVVGIATQDPEHEKRYDIDVESWNIHRFLESVRWQLASVVHAHGYSSVYELSRDDLVALTPGGRRDHASRVRAGVRSRHARQGDCRGPVSRARFTAHQSPTSTAPTESTCPAVPEEFASARRRRGHPLRAGAVPGRVPDRDGRAVVHRVHLGGEDRGGVRGDHGDEPVLVGLRPRLRRSLRAGLPPRGVRRAARDPQPEALRHGQARRHYRPTAGAGHEDSETVGIVGGGPAGLTAAQDLAEAGYAVHVYELTEMLGGYMTWGIPAFRCPPEVFQEDIDRILARCPGITVHLEHGARPRRHPRGARRSATTPSLLDDRRLVGEGPADGERRRSTRRGRSRVPPARQRRRAARAAGVASSSSARATWRWTPAGAPSDCPAART